MASTLRTAARTDSKLASGLRGIGADARLAGSGIIDAQRAFRAVANAERSAAAVGEQLTKITATLRAASTDVKALSAELKSGGELVNRQTTAAIADTGKAATAAAEKAAIAAGDGTGAAIARSKFSFPSSGQLMGVGLAAFCIYGLVTFYGTDGATINITNMTKLTSTSIQISYTLGSKPPGVPATNPFCLRVGDSLLFSGGSTGFTIPSITGLSLPIIAIPGGGSCVVQTPNAITSVGGGSTSFSGTWGTAVVSSTFSSQFAGSVGDVGDAIITAATDVATDLISSSAVVVNAAVDAGENVFCHTVPFLCDSTVLWGAGITCCICIILIIAFFLLK